MTMDKQRVMKYLERQYENLSQVDKKKKLEEILLRLKSLNFLEDETLREVVDSLITQEGWPLSKVLAHLDLIDLDERT